MKRQPFTQKLTGWVIGLALVSWVGHVECCYGQADAAPAVKVALVYTGSTPELRRDVVREIKEQVGERVEFLVYEVPEVLAAIKSTGYVTAAPAAKLIGTYMKAVEAGADAIMNICSTTADIAYSTRGVSAYIGVPIIIVNEEMCREAIRTGSRIGIMATFQVSINPTKKIIERVSREMGKHVETVEVVVEGGYGMEQEQFKALMAAKAKEIIDRVDVIIFTQGSMAYCEEHIETMFKKPVLSNPHYSAKELKAALVAKGFKLDGAKDAQ